MNLGAKTTVLPTPPSQQQYKPDHQVETIKQQNYQLQEEVWFFVYCKIIVFRGELTFVCSLNQEFICQQNYGHPRKLESYE